MVRKKITIKEIAQKQEADLVVDYILKRKQRGLYTLILVAGLPGSGKTSTCFRIGELLYKKYDNTKKMTANKIIDSFLDLTKSIMNANPEELCVFVIEEVSVLFPSRRAMSGINVDLARLLDTARKKQVVLLANAPIWNSVDSHMRALGNVYIETRKIYKKEKIVMSKFFKLQTNPHSGKTYTHSFRRDGRKVKRMFTGMPDTYEWQLYESRKDSFLNNLYRILVKREHKRQDKEDKEMGVSIPTIRPLTTKELQVHELVNVQKLKQVEAARKMGIDVSNVNKKLHNIYKKMLMYKENGKFDTENRITQPIK